MHGEETQSWYVLYVRSRYEKKVDQLFKEKGITSFLPLVETWRQWSDRKKKVSAPLFRGYVFVRINHKNDHYRVLDTEGVVKFIGIGKAPSVVPERDIQWIKMLVGAPDALCEVLPELPSGQHVKVIAGPFLGLEGVVRKEGRASKLVVYFDCVMQGIEVLIDPNYLQPIEKISSGHL